jgi:multiple sugar transport system ATP-binding protein
MPATVDGGTVSLPMVDVRLPEDLRQRIGQAEGGGRELIAGIRPENFEDAALLGDEARGRGATFKARIDLIEAMGSELYAHFRVTSEQRIDSDQLRELAEDAGVADVPGGGEEGEVIARLSAESQVKRDEDAELFIDASHIQLFDTQSGASLTAG